MLASQPGIEPTSLTSPALAGKLFTPSAIWEAQANCSNPQTWESGADCVFKLSFKSGQIKMNEFQSVPVAFSFWEEHTLRFLIQFSSVPLLSPVWFFVTPWTSAHQASLSMTNSWSLLKLMSIESVMPSNHLILCRLFLLLPSIFPSIRVFSNVSSLHQMAKVLEFQLQHQSFQWIFRTDYLQDWLKISHTPVNSKYSVYF